MKIISFDVGIKNLAYIYLDNDGDKKEINILKWGIIDLSCPENYKCCFENCKIKANYYFNDITCNTMNYYCKKHTKNNKLKLLPNELKERNVKNKKVNELKVLNDKYKICENFTIKKEFMTKLDEYVNNNFLIEIPKENANNIDLIQLGIRMKHRMNEEFLSKTDSKDSLNIEKVYIENQISPIANRMKTLQGMLSQYFIMNNVEDIVFCSSINKLKEISTKKLNYKERKQLGITTTNDVLKTKINNGNEYIDYFNNNKKKDDLADCLLQALFYIKN